MVSGIPTATVVLIISRKGQEMFTGTWSWENVSKPLLWQQDSLRPLNGLEQNPTVKYGKLEQKP